MAQPEESQESERKPRYREQIAAVEKTKAVLRLLGGESIDALSHELNVSVRRIDRWRTEFVAAGSDALAQRKDLNTEGWFARHSKAITQWTLLLIALVTVVTLMVIFLQRGSGD